MREETTPLLIAPSAPCGPVGVRQLTAVTSLTRKADRRQFISDLVQALVVDRDLGVTFRVREERRTTTLDIERPELKAMIWIDHKKGSVPLIHWHEAEADLRDLRSAWQTVNSYHHRKATSFPGQLDAATSMLVTGMLAAVDGSAIKAPD